MEHSSSGIPVVRVGIMTANPVTFLLSGSFRCEETGEIYAGGYTLSQEEGGILLNSSFYPQLHFNPLDTHASFTLKEVTIGVDFHWQRKEDQQFRGALHLLSTEDGIVCMNRIDIEEYLLSVISSEMNATASREFLKAHAVISRSWLLAQLDKNRKICQQAAVYCNPVVTGKEMIRWYDREDHQLFDVCADDHCQRYQGITRASDPRIKELLAETCGEVLYSEGEIGDTRFSKCCGGVTEDFESCWEPVHHPALVARRDAPENIFPDLTSEPEAEAWIRTRPEAFCNTTDPHILSQVLNTYDQETTDFYRWQVIYTQSELSSLIYRRSGRDFGDILDLIPEKRGASGRIEKLTIVGSKLRFTIGKELEIRRTLAETHLYSSAFVVDKKYSSGEIPEQFVLTGAGWGHGVGLCQIGAAVMGEKGYSYQQILSHYFQHSQLQRLY